MDHSMDYLQDTREEEAQGPAPTFGLSRDSPAPPADMHLLRQSGKGASLDRCAPPNPLHGAPLPCATFHERARDFTRDAALSPPPRPAQLREIAELLGRNGIGNAHEGDVLP